MEKDHELEFSDGPVVRTPRFHCRGRGFNPRGTKIPQDTQHDQKKKIVSCRVCVKAGAREGAG